MMLWKSVYALLSVADISPFPSYSKSVYELLFSKTMDGLYRSVFWRDKLENVARILAKS